MCSKSTLAQSTESREWHTHRTMADGKRDPPKRARNNPMCPDNRRELRVHATVYMYACIVITYSRVQINRKVANPVHGQLNKEKFPCPRSRLKFGFARQVWPSRPVSACSFSMLTSNLVHTHGVPPDIRGGVHIFLPPYTIGSLITLLGHAIAYRWRSLPRIRCVQTLSLLLLYYCCTHCGPVFPSDLCPYKCKEFSVHGTISYVVFQNIPVVITAVL